MLKSTEEKNFSLQDQEKVNDKFEKEFNKNPLIKNIRLLKELYNTEYSKHFLKHLASLNIEKGSEILAGRLAIDIGRYDFAIQIAKQASYEKRFYNEINYPVIQTAEIVNQKNNAKE